MGEKIIHTWWGTGGGIFHKYQNSYLFFCYSLWGWGGSDDDLYHRLIDSGVKVKFLPPKEGNYLALDHEQAVANPDRWNVLDDIRTKSQQRGLKQSQYKIADVIQTKVYTHIKAITKVTPEIKAKFPVGVIDDTEEE